MAGTESNQINAVSAAPDPWNDGVKV